ncbi:RluA family pseudouridine synthase [Candidatus Saccharibacteria bacterium]|nr:RluA family pseudouridine synthase [Candidatus Saccharibacteria bacterium]
MAKKFSKPNLSRQINGDLPTNHSADDYDDSSITPQLSRLDKALAELYPEYSRATLQKFIKNGQVTLDGAVVLSPKQLINPDTTTIHLDQHTSLSTPCPPILYEDTNVLVLNKPTGLLSVCKGDATPEPSLEDFGLIVHRLDRDTSGVIILAKNPETASLLQKQFQQRKTHKTYYAIVFGRPAEPHAIINVPLARNLKRPTTFMPSREGREALTEYRVLETVTIPRDLAHHHEEQSFSLVELKPKTGRTHQLRIHLAHLGTPIVGDPVYGDQKLEKLFPASRMFLHAAALEITIPTSQRQNFVAPLPDAFLHPFDYLAFHSPQTEQS